MRVSTVLGCALCLLAPATLLAQAPLATDDAAVADRRRLHFEIFNQYARLARAERPVRGQNTLVLTTSFGLTSRLEVGFDMPWIAILPELHGASGVGDLNLTAKWLWRQPAAGRTGFALTGAVELPTGDEEKNLGAGVIDSNLGLVIERGVSAKTTWRGNLGIQFGGNTLTGVVGSRARGQVLSAATSVTHDFGERWSAAFELSGYEGREAARADRELRAQVTGVFVHSPRMSIATAIQRGWQATPPWTFQIGLILDP
jgi:hypothetical protein